MLHTKISMREWNMRACGQNTGGRLSAATVVILLKSENAVAPHGLNLIVCGVGGGATVGITANVPPAATSEFVPGTSSILSVGIYGGFKSQATEVQGTWTNQQSWYLGGGVGLSF